MRDGSGCKTGHHCWLHVGCTLQVCHRSLKLEASKPEDCRCSGRVTANIPDLVIGTE